MCTLTGLLAGLWEFLSLPQAEKNSDIKEKKALCAEINRILGSHLTDGLLQSVGEVSFEVHHASILHTLTSTLTLPGAASLPCDVSLIGLLQVVHIFSHIHQTYVVHSLRLKDAHTRAQSENAQWLSRSALQEAAVSTGVKKVFI